MQPRDSGVDISAISSHWEKRLQEKKDELVAAIFGKNENDKNAVSRQIFDEATIRKFHRSLGEDGIYKISVQDSPLINQIKSVLNVLTSMARLGPELARPLQNYLQSEGGYIFSKLNLLFHAADNISDITNFFARDLYDLQFYMQELNKVISEMPGLDSTILPTLMEVRNIVTTEISPVIEYVSKIQAKKSLGEEGGKESISHAGQLLAKALQKKKISVEKEQIVSKSTLETITLTIGNATDIFEKFILEKYGIKKGKKNYFDTDLLMKKNMSENEKYVAENILRAANIVNGMQGTLERIDNILSKGQRSIGQILEVIEEIKRIVNEFDQIKIDVDLIRSSGADILLKEMGKIMTVTQHSMVEVVKYVELVEGKLGINEMVLQGKIQELCKNHEAVSENIGVKLNKRYPYWVSRLAVRHQEFILERGKFEELKFAKIEIETLHKKIAQQFSKEDLKNLLMQIKKFSCPQTYNYEYELTRLIAKFDTMKSWSEINVLTKDLIDNLNEVMQLTIDREKDNVEKSGKRVAIALESIKVEGGGELYRKKELDVISSIQVEQLLTGGKEYLQSIRTILISMKDKRCEGLIGIIDRAIRFRGQGVIDYKLDKFEEFKSEVIAMMLDRIVSDTLQRNEERVVVKSKSFQEKNMIRENSNENLNEEKDERKSKEESLVNEKWSSTISSIKGETLKTLKEYLSSLGVDEKEVLKSTDNMHYKIELNDPLIIRNLKSILNVVASIERLLDSVQSAYQAYDPEAGLYGRLRYLYQQGSVTLPNIKDITKELKKNFYELTYYANKIQSTMPDVEKIYKPLSSFRNFELSNIPYFDEMVSPRNVVQFKSKCIEQTNEVMSYFAKLKDSVGLSQFMENINIPSVITMADKVKEISSGTFNRSNMIEKIKLLDVSQELIQGRVNKGLGLVDFNKEKYGKTEFKIARKSNASELTHLMLLSNSITHLRNICLSAATISKGGLLKGVLNILPTLVTVLDDYKLIDESYKKEISPTLLSFVNDLIIPIKPFLAELMAESAVMEFKFGVKAGTLTDPIESLCGQIESFSGTYFGKKDDVRIYYQLVEKALSSVTPEISQQRLLIGKLKNFIDDPTGKSYKEATIKDLLQYRDYALLLPPSASMRFVNSINDAISNRIGLTEVEAKVSDARMSYIQANNNFIKVKSKSISIQHKILENKSNQDVLVNFMSKMKEGSMKEGSASAHAALSLQEIDILYHFPPQTSLSKEKFVEKLYLLKSEGLVILQQKFDFISHSTTQLLQSLNECNKEIEVYTAFVNGHLKRLTEAEKQAEPLRKILSEVSPDMSAIKDQPEKMPAKPDCTDLKAGIDVFQRESSEQISDIDKRIHLFKLKDMTFQSIQKNEFIPEKPFQKIETTPESPAPKKKVVPAKSSSSTIYSKSGSTLFSGSVSSRSIVPAPDKSQDKPGSHKKKH